MISIKHDLLGLPGRKLVDDMDFSPMMKEPPIEWNGDLYVEHPTLGVAYLCRQKMLKD